MFSTTLIFYNRKYPLSIFHKWRVCEELEYVQRIAYVDVYEVIPYTTAKITLTDIGLKAYNDLLLQL